ncbi:MAG: CHASE domain-containing protein [Actinomycetota bacterium]
MEQQGERRSTSLVTALDVTPPEHTGRGVGPAVALAAVVLVVGLVITALLVAWQLDRGEEVDELSLERRADAAVAQLDAAIDNNVDLISGLQAFFRASAPVTRAEFTRYVRSLELATRFPEAQAVEWAPVVREEDRVAFELQVRADDSVRPGGYPSFAVTPMTGAAEMVVVDYVEPYAGNEAAHGFDLISDPDRRAAVAVARASGTAAATAPLTLVQETDAQAGFLLVLLVDPRGEPGAEGVVVAVFRAGDLIADAVSADHEVALEVRDVGASEAGAADLLFLDETKPSSAAFTTRTLDVGGRTWAITIRPTAAVATSPVGAVAVGVLGLALAGVTSAYLFSVAASRDRAERIASTATADLEASVEELARTNEDLEQFAYAASHDLQTPARNVDTCVTLLRDSLDDHPDEEVHEYLDSSRRRPTR